MTLAVAWGTLYALFYLAFAPHWWLLLLLPFHWLMGPVHGAIVNWAGHKIGYRNYDSDDNSKNTLVFDVLTMGELFQNNHHKWGQSPELRGARLRDRSRPTRSCASSRRSASST